MLQAALSHKFYVCNIYTVYSVNKELLKVLLLKITIKGEKEDVMCVYFLWRNFKMVFGMSAKVKVRY